MTRIEHSINEMIDGANLTASEKNAVDICLKKIQKCEIELPQIPRILMRYFMPLLGVVPCAELLRSFQRVLIAIFLIHFDGNISVAASNLGMLRTTLSEVRKDLGFPLRYPWRSKLCSEARKRRKNG